MKRKPIKTRFPYLLWHWTNTTENLFTLTREQLYFFKLLIDEANK